MGKEAAGGPRTGAPHHPPSPGLHLAPRGPAHEEKNGQWVAVRGSLDGGADEGGRVHRMADVKARDMPGLAEPPLVEAEAHRRHARRGRVAVEGPARGQQEVAQQRAARLEGHVLEAGG